ncbi:MAG: bifunctional UDP-sugar hydrolase/5'-nucleotidase [Clostridia bacterium]|nr:bifunctional UDP-sugar hydrolase/5'-nucleotidase [Clostridia bacterium]
MNRTCEIRFTSDTHGYLYPTNYADTSDRPMGLMKLAGAFAHDGNTLIIDGGDTIQGSPLTNLYHRLPADEQAACLTSDRYGTHPIAAMMNLAGYQFVTLGNHDFNQGIDALADYLNNLDAICLCANIRDKAGILPIAPYAIHRLENGLRVGIVGACTHYVTRWENPKTTALLTIEEPIPAAARALETIKPQCDITVLIYHGGFECDLTTGEPLTDSAENQACRICRELDFDLVLTGHQHMRVDGVRFGNSYAVQPAYRAPHACGVTITVHEDGSKTFDSAILPARGEALPEAAALLSPLESRVQQWLDTPAGHLDLPLDAGEHLDKAINGSYLANFINTVQRHASGAQISSCALPNEFKGLPAAVTVRDVVSTYIYANTLLVLELDTHTLRRYIERSAAYFDHNEDGSLCISDEFLRPKVQHYNYDYFSGIDYVIDVRRPVGQRVTSIKLDGRELAETDTVTVCINSYRSCGTGGYDMLLGQKIVRDIQVDVADAIIEYIVNHPDIKVDTKKYCTVIG